MSLQKLCVSLETAEALVEAGIVIESIHYLLITHNETKLEIPTKALRDDIKKGEYYCHDWKLYPAPTAEEIERFMTGNYSDARNSYESFFEQDTVSVRCYDWLHEELFSSGWYSNKTEAMAEITLWLKKEGYLG